jgi:hypothetical protein
MKKISFNKLERNQDELGNFTYSFRTIKDHNEGLTELLDSFVEKGYKFEQVHNSSIDTNTSIVVSINVIDMEDVNLCKEINKILNIDCKNIFIELSCYDHQEIDIRFYNFCRENTNKELWFIDKNMLQVSDDCLFFEHHCWHTNMYMPKYKDSFIQLNK